MLKVLNPETNHTKIPIKLWASNIESEACVQITHLANLPFAFHHTLAVIKG